MEQAAKIDNIIGNLQKATGAAERAVGTANFTKFFTEILKKKGSQDESKRRKLTEEPTPAKVVSIGDEAVQQLSKIFSKSQRQRMAPTPSEKAQSKKLPFGLLTAGAIGVLGGLAALVTGITQDGKLSGWLKLVARAGIEGGLKVISKAIGSFLKVPETIKALKKFVPENLMPKLFKSMKAGFGKILGLGGKTGGKTGSKMVLKRIPVLGSLISFAFAWKNFQSGAHIAGFLDVASGIATLFPGPGTLISIGIDVLNAFMQMKSAPKEGETKVQAEARTLKEIMSTLLEKITSSFPIKNLMDFGEGISLIITGDVDAGLTKMESLIPGLSFMRDFMAMDAEQKMAVSLQKIIDVKAFFGEISDMVSEKIKGIFTGAKSYLKEQLGIHTEADQATADNSIRMMRRRLIQSEGYNARILAEREAQQQQLQMAEPKAQQLKQPYITAPKDTKKDDKELKAIQKGSADTVKAINEGNMARQLSVISEQLNALNETMAAQQVGTNLISVGPGGPATKFPKESAIKLQREGNRR